MKFSLDERLDVYTVSAYGLGYVEFSIPTYLEEDAELLKEGLNPNEGRQKVSQSVVVLPGQLQKWPPASFSELEKSHFQSLLELKPEVVVVGTGERLRFPASYLVEPLLRHQVGVEFMDTAAACRTYNILVGEGRRVIAALLMITNG
ncbi:Mth938-like domain-containing protein [Nitrosococcus wardiae]|uniref:Xcc1710-like domain-containing protein n=1 Tax=Nitrosococcus wardiae TaxID=1814290 RepID=A0A4P7C0F2_9GAMM|nr:Mth938-like domain-containing protein [Nitrosococcus wardiae]QBQ54864.1 hypothetical protein E3U44_10325 [Nitrosococcus wardiae]